MARKSLGVASAAGADVPTRSEVELRVSRTNATAGQVPVLQSNGSLSFATPTAAAGDVYPSPNPVPQVGEWVEPGLLSTATGTFGGAGLLAVGEMFLPAGTYDAAAFNVTTAASAGGVTKVGVYAYNAATGMPGALLLETVAVDVTTTGDKVITGLSLVIPAGGLRVFVGVVTQGAPSTPPAYRNVFASPYAWVSATFNATGSTVPTWQTTGVTGALPASGAAFTRGAGFCRLGLRRSA